MPEHGIRSTYSQCPFQLLMCDQGGVISSGTGFFFETGDRWFLVTNWHNVTGRDFQTGKVISKLARVPSRLVAKLSTYDLGRGQDENFAIGPHDVPLYHGTQPSWLEHPEGGSSFVAAASGVFAENRGSWVCSQCSKSLSRGRAWAWRAAARCSGG